MPTPIFQVDAFTAEPFAGNPAAVCLLDGPADAGWMQRVAQEMNLSETAFVHEMEDGHSLRWFTPTVEVDLCGHATLASAYVLWEAGRLGREQQARFHIRSGLLTAEQRGEYIELDFPATPPETVETMPGLEEALGAEANYSVSRYFAPGAGFDEDPVTGSIHCCLGPFWGERLGKSEMMAYQASARGGMLGVRLAGDRVKLKGQAVTVLRGELA